MPTYEYQCPACDHTWEAEQKITDAPLRVCPRCQQRRAKRLISATSFILTGERWAKKQGY